jgi:hypothetical protein
LKGFDRQRPTIILGHHPIKCFLREDQSPFETLLREKSAIYIHGHEHDPILISNADGTIRALGFGATYIAALGKEAHAPYRNSFARCRVDNRLQLDGFSWDHHLGKWDNATKTQYANCAYGETYDGKSVVLNMPLISDKSAVRPVTPVLVNIPRKIPEPQSIIPVASVSPKIWLRLLALSKNVNTHYRHNPDTQVEITTERDGKCEFITEESNKRDLLICVPGATHILSSKEMESYNTRLDTEDFRSVTVLSFGKLSSEAREMYIRLKGKKHIEVLANQELTAEWQELLSPKQVQFLANRDAAIDTAIILIDNDQIYLLIQQGGSNASFSLVETAGGILAATHKVVAQLRESIPKFSKLDYFGGSPLTLGMVAVPDFDEKSYLQQCYSEYNAIKYAALANVGIRFSDFSLEDVYIDASACEKEDAQSNRIDELLEDHLAAYPASENLKNQIKQQFRAHIERSEGHETSQAREFCQKYGAVLLTGDPGSGKTCFVKSEILAYSRKVMEAISSKGFRPDDWHSIHIPVMIPLSQAAAEADLETIGLLTIASRLLERRGFFLPINKINDLLKEGRLALFFDGLDEVVSIEKRAVVVQHINDIVSKYLSLGNRVVVTSRPAALNVVNLLPALRQLELQGLTQTEIRVLANRVLTVRLSETTEGVVLEDKELRASDSAIVNKLLEDCAQKPGVARFATNPLLLTLLVMIYANSGAPSAKRHRIYEEAIVTLSSVRGRQAGHSPVSVQDLRERLGAVALSVYRKDSGLLLTLKEVTEVVRAVMSKKQGENVPKSEAQRFVQKVAESTGLIAIGASHGKGDDEGIVTFMHHSFMEFFAAVGLSRELASCDVKLLVTQPRWIEILTLLAGIIGESEDIAPILTRFVGDGSNYGETDARFLIFALDCALECEVPSEAAVKLLSTSITKCFHQGPGRTDPWVRSEIGQRLGHLIQDCGFAAFEPMFTALIRNGEADVCAAAICLTSYACEHEPESKEVLKAIEDSCSRPEESVQCAICDAASRVEWTRTPLVMQVVAKSFKKTARCKRAGFEAILAIPGLAAKHWTEIINGLDDTAVGVRRLASKAAIVAGLDSDIAALNDSRKDLVANALRYVSESATGHEFTSKTVRQDTIDQLMKSGIQRDRLIGIQLMPATDAGNDVAYRKLMELLSNQADHQELTAALRTLRSSQNTRLLFVVGDLRLISKLVQIGTYDVRKAAIQLLGCFTADISAIKPLLDLDSSSITAAEFEAVFAALGRSQVLQPEIITVLETEILSRTKDGVRLTADYVVEICALLDAVRSLSKNLRPQVAGEIRKLISDYKQDERVKKAAIRAYFAAATPSQTVAEFLTTLFKSPPVGLVAELPQSLAIFAKNCRQSVEHIMACVESLANLRAASMFLHERLSKREATADNEFTVTELRNGIYEVSQIIVTFEEFINPTRPHPEQLLADFSIKS